MEYFEIAKTWTNLTNWSEFAKLLSNQFTTNKHLYKTFRSAMPNNSSKFILCHSCCDNSSVFPIVQCMLYHNVVYTPL